MVGRTVLVQLGGVDVAADDGEQLGDATNGIMVGRGCEHRRADPGSPVQACSSTSIGISMCTGLVRRPVKLPNASVTAAATSSALRTRRLHRTS